MLLFLLGAIALGAPFLFMPFFGDRRKGFLIILLLDITFQLFLALFAQALHIFFYLVILIPNLCIALPIIFLFFRDRSKIIRKEFKIDWIAIGAFAIIFLELLSIRFFYSGPVSTYGGIQEVSRSYYPYPQFSDEWIGSSFVSYSIQSHSLPIANPLTFPVQPFPNPLVGFFSLLASLFLILNLNPLTQFSFAAVFAGFSVCASLYFLLRTYGARSSIAVFAALSVPFIVQAGNLPGIWFLLPFIPSFSLLIVSLTCIELDESFLLSLSSFLALVLYPPMIVFVLPVLFIHIYEKQESKRAFGAALLAVAALCGLACMGIFFLSGGNLGGFFPTIVRYLFRTNLVAGIPAFAPWTIMPILSLPFAALGLYLLYRRKKFALLAAVSAGAVFWIAYLFTTSVFVIDYPRVVMIVCLLAMTAAGVGAEGVLVWLQSDYVHFSEKKYADAAQWAFLGLFLIAAFYYPAGSRWKNLPLVIKNEKGIAKVPPAPPINRYLTADDLRLFIDIHGKRFIAPDWKGLVIGVATGNYPMESKPSIITNTFVSYDAFMKLDCKAKTDLAQAKYIAYAYGGPIDCLGFKELGTSSEGFNLYAIPQKPNALKPEK